MTPLHVFLLLFQVKIIKNDFFLNFHSTLLRISGWIGTVVQFYTQFTTVKFSPILIWPICFDMQYAGSCPVSQIQFNWISYLFWVVLVFLCLSAFSSNSSVIGMGVLFLSCYRIVVEKNVSDQIWAVKIVMWLHSCWKNAALAEVATSPESRYTIPALSVCGETYFSSAPVLFTKCFGLYQFICQL